MRDLALSLESEAPVRRIRERETFAMQGQPMVRYCEKGHIRSAAGPMQDPIGWITCPHCQREERYCQEDEERAAARWAEKAQEKRRGIDL